MVWPAKRPHAFLSSLYAADRCTWMHVHCLNFGFLAVKMKDGFHIYIAFEKVNKLSTLRCIYI